MRTEKAASKVTIKHNENPNPFGFGFLLCADRFEKLNAARMSAACEGLTEQHNNFSSHREEKCNQIWPVPPPIQEIAPQAFPSVPRRLAPCHDMDHTMVDQKWPLSSKRNVHQSVCVFFFEKQDWQTWRSECRYPVYICLPTVLRRQHRMRCLRQSSNQSGRYLPW